MIGLRFIFPKHLGREKVVQLKKIIVVKFTLKHKRIQYHKNPSWAKISPMTDFMVNYFLFTWFSLIIV